MLYKEAGSWAVGIHLKNTSQTCSGCGNIVSKTMATRIHNCLQCGLKIDRDINAARNILQLALQAIGSYKPKPLLHTAGTAGINACEVGRLLPTTKQEATVFKRW